MKLLLVGCGYWGRNWAKTLAFMNVLAGICEPAPANQDFLRLNYPNIPVYSTLDEALSMCGATGAIIASIASTHAEVTRNCLRAGLHVLVEKPLALSNEDAESMVNMAWEHGRILAAGHLLMYHPGLLRLKALMDSGVLGDILSIQCTRTNLGKIRNEENVWWSLAPHDLSILSLLLDEPFYLKNASSMTTLGRANLPDTVSAWYETDRGCQASIHVSWLAPEKKHETVVIGTQKMAIFDDAKPIGQKLALLDYSLSRTGESIHDIQRGKVKLVPYEVSDELLALEVQAFLEAIHGTKPDLLNDGKNGLEIVKQLNAVQTMLGHATSLCTSI